VLAPQEVLVHKGVSHMTDDELREFMKAADHNGDGRIDYHEFVEANRKLLGLPKKRKDGSAYRLVQKSARNLFTHKENGAGAL